ncbi:MAG: polysaccharide biosynthesis tyrosine autokinase [Phycisphaerales bacterium]|nr:polysaccharide biosynthesis tyrosine autokinase [Phycisphaerales bacterium]
MSGFANIDPIRLLRRYWPLLAGAAVFGGVIGVAAHFTLLKVYPTWTASSVFRCEPPRRSPTELRGVDMQQVEFDRFMGTQMTIMLSPDVLGRAVRNPDLVQSNWAKQFVVNGNFQSTQAVTKLQDTLSPRLVPQTTLIRLSFSWRKKEDARAVVDAVTKAYLQSVKEQKTQESTDQRTVLENRRSAINLEITGKSKRRDSILTKNGITNLRDGANQWEQKQLEQIRNLADTEQQLTTIVSLRDRLRNATDSQGTVSYPEDMLEEAKLDPIIQDLKREISQLRVSEQTLLSQDYGEKHPSLVSLRERIKASEARQDEEMAKVLRRIYDARVEEISKSVESTAKRREQVAKDLDEISTKKQAILLAIKEVEQIDEEIKQLGLELNVVNEARQNIETMNDSAVYDQVKLVIPAQTPNVVSFPKLVVMLPLGVLLFTGLTAMIVLLRELMDQRVKGPADVAIIPRLKVLGMIPDAAEDPARPTSIETAFRDTPGGVVTESFRQVKAPLVKKMDTEGLRTLLVLAGMPGSGATTVACNLAIACAASDDRVLVIDANVRRPAMQRVFGITESVGLADCLAGQAGFDEAVRPTGVANLSVLTAGTPGNRMMPERLSSEAMTRLLAEAASKFDRVFIDCPPAIVSGDGLALANRCDASLMVVRALNEKRGLVNRVRTQLSEARAELVGVVVNGVKSSAGGYFKRNIQATHEYHNAAKPAA